MTDSKLLKDLIEKSGIKLGFIVKNLKTSYSTLKKQINNEKPFSAEDIQILCVLLRIDDLKTKDRIFFAQDVEKNSTKNQKGN